MCQKYMKAKFLTVEKRKIGKRISLSDGFCFSCHSERRSEGPKSRNLLLSTDLSTAARGDMEDGKGGRSFDCAQDDRAARDARAWVQKRGMEKEANAFLLA